MESRIPELVDFDGDSGAGRSLSVSGESENSKGDVIEGVDISKCLDVRDGDLIGVLGFGLDAGVD
jgi:hypothetical protein